MLKDYPFSTISSFSGCEFIREAGFNDFLEGSLTLAEEKRDSIPLQFDLSTWAVAEHAYYEDLTDIIIEARMDSTHYAAYDSTTVLLIEDIADNSEGLAGRLARGLLNTFYGYDYSVIPQDINVYQMRSSQSIGNTSTRRFNSRELIAVPNPVREQVIFHFNLPEGVQSGVLKVYDVNGKQAAELHLNTAQGQIRWLTGNQQRGLYYCVIEQAGYRSTPLKLLLID